VRFRILICSAFVLAMTCATAGTAAAQDGSGQYTHTSAGASTGPGEVTVSATGSKTEPSKLARSGPGVSRSTNPANPNQPYSCSYAVPSASTQELLGVGGATPGRWVYPMCKGPGVIDPLAPVWVVVARHQAPVNPTALGQQAVSELRMPSPTIEMAPPADASQLVNVTAWMWIDAGAWKPLTVTATAGTVRATATATPFEVLWNVGDGNQITCDGPGIPYNASNPSETTYCSYTWPAPGTYHVVATIYWHVVWTAVGAAGGGNLGLEAGPAAQMAVTVTESQAINTPTS
jgi:hypothetical protein